VSGIRDMVIDVARQHGCAAKQTFPDVLERLYCEQYTGPVILHFAQGRPNHVEIPAKPETIVLDKRDRSTQT